MNGWGWFACILIVLAVGIAAYAQTDADKREECLAKVRAEYSEYLDNVETRLLLSEHEQIRVRVWLDGERDKC